MACYYLQPTVYNGSFLSNGIEIMFDLKHKSRTRLCDNEVVYFSYIFIRITAPLGEVYLIIIKTYVK